MSMNDLRSSASAMALRSSRLLNGGFSRLMIRLVLTLIGAISQIGGRVLRLDVLDQRRRHLGRKGHVDLAGDEGEHRGRAIADDRVFDAVEIRQALLPIVRILRELDRFVLLELDELERTGADRMRAHLRRRDVARIHRRIAGREHRQQRGLRPLEMQRHLEVAIGGDVGNVVEQVLARILAELVLPLALQQVEGAFHVLGW